MKNKWYRHNILTRICSTCTLFWSIRLLHGCFSHITAYNILICIFLLARTQCFPIILDASRRRYCFAPRTWYIAIFIYDLGIITNRNTSAVTDQLWYENKQEFSKRTYITHYFFWIFLNTNPYHQSEIKLNSVDMNEKLALLVSIEWILDPGVA